MREKDPDLQEAVVLSLFLAESLLCPQFDVSSFRKQNKQIDNKLKLGGELVPQE